jgi:hypothetical protein
VHRDLTENSEVGAGGHLATELGGPACRNLHPVPKKRDIIIGKEYIYDPKKGQVFVPLGRK